MICLQSHAVIVTSFKALTFSTEQRETRPACKIRQPAIPNVFGFSELR